jgi:uncharacterized protein YbjT (DUF2867 family)
MSALCIAISSSGLLRAIRGSGRAIRLVHISIPGAAAADRTAFSRTKREAERLVAVFGIPHAILTPDLWIEPLGALVKTGPAIVLMLVALLTLDNR